MKKIILFIAICSSILVSCKKSDQQSTTTTPTNSIIGKWKEAQLLYVYYVGVQEVYREVTPAPATTSYDEYISPNIYNSYNLQPDKSFKLSFTGSYTFLNSNTIEFT